MTNFCFPEQNVNTELVFLNSSTMSLKLTELNGINFNATLFIYGFPIGSKTKFHALLKPDLIITKDTVIKSKVNPKKY